MLNNNNIYHIIILYIVRNTGKYLNIGTSYIIRTKYAQITDLLMEITVVNTNA